MKHNDASERFRRPADMSIKDYINEFERLLSKTKNLVQQCLLIF